MFDRILAFLKELPSGEADKRKPAASTIRASPPRR